MAHQPQAFRFQPPMSLAPHACGGPFSSGFVPGPGMDGPSWISSGPAYAPYSTSARSPQLYGGEIRPGAFVTPGYNPSARIMMPGPYLHNDPMYRKYAKANPTHTLTAWLEDHLKHPYPTQSEKVMLAILTRMTLQEVSSWFAKARRPFRIENKIRRKWKTVKVDGGTMKTTRSGPWEKNQSAVPPPHCLMSRNGGGSGDKDPNWWPPLIPDPAQNHAPFGGLVASEVERMSKGISGSAVQGSDPVPQPKPWSLPEMAKSQSGWAGPQAQMWTPYSHAPPRHLYYTPPFMSGYSGYTAVGNRPGTSPPATTFEQIPADGAAAIRGLNPGPPTWRS